MEQAQDQIQDDFLALARWPRLRDPTLLPPTVGGIESDPSGVADQYGVKGQSVLTAFVNVDDFSCRICGFKAETVQLADFHQQQARHFYS